jgi:hypothetical protein
MADLSSAITRAGVSGGVKKLGSFAAKALFVVVASDTASLTLTEAATVYDIPVRDSYTQTWGRVGISGGVKRYGDLAKDESSLALIGVTDIAYLQGNEDPVDAQELLSNDTATLTIAEAISLLNRADVFDTASLSLSETVALAISGVTLKTPTDTASLTLSESVDVGVTIDVTDTATLDVTDSGTVDVSKEDFPVTDDASLTLDEQVFVEVFAGVLSIPATDTATITIVENATAREIKPGIRRITFGVTTPRIQIEVL